MTRKDYEAVARMFRIELNLPQTKDTLNTIGRLANRFADRAIMDNPRFKRDVFLAACGLSDV